MGFLDDRDGSWSVNADELVTFEYRGHSVSVGFFDECGEWGVLINHDPDLLDRSYEKKEIAIHDAKAFIDCLLDEEKWIVEDRQNLTACDTFNEESDGPTDRILNRWAFNNYDEAVECYEKKKLMLKAAGLAGQYVTYPVFTVYEPLKNQDEGGDS